MRNKHISFLGIDIDGDVDDFGAKLISYKGYELTQDAYDYQMYEGIFAGRNAIIQLSFSPSTNQIYEVIVFIDANPSWSCLKDEYYYFKELFIQKYGEPDTEYEKFKEPYFEGDGYEVAAFSDHGAIFTSSFLLDGGEMWVSILGPHDDFGPMITLSYEDRYNKELYEADINGIAYNDI